MFLSEMKIRGGLMSHVTLTLYVLCFLSLHITYAQGSTQSGGAAVHLAELSKAALSSTSVTNAKKAYEYNEDGFVRAPFYPWNEDLAQDANTAILERMRSEMFLEVNEDSLPAVMLSQRNMQAEIGRAKSIRETDNTIAADSNTNTNTNTNTIKRPRADQVAFARLVDTMVNNTAAMRNILGEKFSVHVVYHEQSHSEDTHAADTADTAGPTGSSYVDPDNSQVLPEEYAATARKVSQALRQQANEVDKCGVDVELEKRQEKGHDQKLASEKKDDTGSASGEWGHISSKQQQELAQTKKTLAMLTAKPPMARGLTNSARINARVHGLCLMLPTGYWTYEWCHAESVKQFHLERNQQSGRDSRTNELSLGNFHSSTAIRERLDNKNASAAIEHIVEKYTGGPVCNIGGRDVERTSTVTMQCCTVAINEIVGYSVPEGVEPATWYQMQTLIRSTNVPDNPMILHNPNDNKVQPAALRSQTDALKPGNEHLANYKGTHHPPHHTPFHSGKQLDMQAKAGQAPAKEESEKYETWGHLAGFLEQSMCQYQFIVCLPLLCPPSDVNIGDESQASLQRKAHEIPTAGLQQALQTLKARAKPKTILDVMEVLISKCHVRLEEWWTYELCFNTGIRQFHMQAMSVADNAGKPAATQMKVTGEFSLGTAPFSVLRSLSALEAAVVGTGPERPGETNGKLTRPAGLPSSVLQRKYKPKTLVLSYEGGTPCDIENIQRASVVEVTCSPNGADSIVDIIEDRTCHYLIKVHSALLCELDGFKRPREKATMLSFIPDTQEVSARFKLQEALGVDLAREYGDKMRQESWLRNERMAAEAASSRNRRNIEKNEEKRGRNLAKELPPLPNPRGLHLE